MENLSIQSITPQGWDNKTFRLGKKLLARFPSSVDYAAQVAKEQFWLPKLAPLLPLRIPEPVAMGKPDCGYPFQWSIYRWLVGETAAAVQQFNLNDFAVSLSKFLVALQKIDSTGGPKAGKHNFYRGGNLAVYDAETRQAITALINKIDAKTALAIWDAALATTWQNDLVWVHGDISAGNLLIKNGKLDAVIDFGQLGIGDPACDLMIAWTMFKGENRKLFQENLQLDNDTWLRARAWTLWKALGYIMADQVEMNFEAKQAWFIIDEVCQDYRQYI
jgi:aminoglycoside phosphotransferase (APT) family kinase protein